MQAGPYLAVGSHYLTALLKVFFPCCTFPTLTLSLRLGSHPGLFLSSHSGNILAPTGLILGL
jgi:hypothetical protein